MDVNQHFREMRAYYEARYKKAIAIGINESSKHYAAFQEVELRYIALSLITDWLDTLEERVYKDGLKKYCFSFFFMILEKLLLNEIIIDEDGKKRYLPYKVHIPKNNTEAIEAYFKAQEAFDSIRQMYYHMEDKGQFLEEFKEKLFYMINWLIIAREIVFPVNRNAKKPA